MILPIIAYGDPLLLKKSAEVSDDHAGLQNIIADMFETMYHAKGIGLAAPQIGHSIRILIIDSTEYFINESEDDKDDDDLPMKVVFINPVIVKEYGDEFAYNEGCLSIPGIREDVTRAEKTVVQFFDENFTKREEHLTGINARVFLHEFDHLEGIMFVDKIKPLKKRLLKKKLDNISKGQIDVFYEMKYPKKKK